MLAIEWRTSLGDVRSRVSAAELPYWLALYKMGMWNDQRQDRRQANLMCMYANAHRDTKKNPSAFVPDDFMLFPTGKKADKDLKQYRELRAGFKSLEKAR